MSRLPSTAPATSREAFAHINQVTAPTVDDLKLMVFLEASGLEAYRGLARGAPSREIAALLEANGREELAHAHRVSKVIKLLTGESFEPPEAAENPYVSAEALQLDAAVLQMLVTAETNGRSLYETWAETIGNAEAAALLRQNGVEETRHGERASEALALMPA